ncbi:MAG: hypothetical protein EOM62_14415, partial [Bacteroidia bacterium]|nr:hypothetical protein [Bacteroidia bacterium]
MDGGEAEQKQAEKGKGRCNEQPHQRLIDQNSQHLIAIVVQAQQQGEVDEHHQKHQTNHDRKQRGPASLPLKTQTLKS